jgi:tetratricopeptide (TPR) repeat protein
MLRRPRKHSFGSDAARVNSLLLYAVLAAVILVLVALAWLVYGVMVRPVAPRTSVERAVLEMELTVKAQPKNGRAWGDYISALINAGQYLKAEQAISDGLRLATDKAPVLVRQAQILHIQGRDDRALEVAGSAIKTANATRDKALQDIRKKGVTAPTDASPDVFEAELVRGDILAARGELKAAVEAYTGALLEKPRMSDVLAMRGAVYAKLGDKAAARADFTEALRYDPENADARRGLAGLGDATK